jgi:DNA invertase Pin-like site-specific DNA recombinase
MVANKSKPLVPYIRQSRAKERTISLDDQRRSIRAWAESAGVKLAPEIVEQGVSGSKHWKKRELGRAVEACQAGKASGIVVAFQDRLSRENGLATAEVWEALEAAGARLVCSSEGLDTATGDHEMLFTIKAAIAREQWKRHAHNWRAGKHAAWERGCYVGPTPAGYERDAGPDGLAVNDVGEPAGLTPAVGSAGVRAAFEEKVNGGTWASVAARLDGLVTSRGRVEWSAAAGRSVIQNAVYTGLHTCTCGCAESVIRPEWKIVDAPLFRAAQKREERAPYVRGESHLLARGLVRCSICGKGLVKSSTAGKYEALRCLTRGGGHPSMSYGLAVDLIVGKAFAHAGAAIRVDGGNEAEVAAADAAVAACTEAVERAATELGLDVGEMHERSLPVVALREAEDARLALTLTGGTETVIFALGLREEFEALPVGEQRAALRGMVKKAVLAPGSGPGSVREPSKKFGTEERLTIEMQDGTWHPAHAAPGWKPDDTLPVATDEQVLEMMLAGKRRVRETTQAEETPPAGAGR